MGEESCILVCRHELEPSALLNERFDGDWRRESGTLDWRSSSAGSIGFELVMTSCRGNGDVAESSTALGSSAFTNHTVDIHRPFWSSSLFSPGFLSSRIVAWYVRRFTSLTRLVPVVARDTPFLEYVSGELPWKLLPTFRPRQVVQLSLSVDLPPPLQTTVHTSLFYSYAGPRQGPAFHSGRIASESGAMDFRKQRD